MTNTLDTFTLAADLQDADLMHLKRGTGVNSDKRVTGATIKAIFATAAQGALADTALQPADVGTAAAEDVGYFATAAQGALADTALQSGANISVLTNDLGFTDDQTDAEIETAYNNQVAAASQVEMEAGVETAIRRMSPLRVAQAIAALAAGGGDVVDDLTPQLGGDLDVNGKEITSTGSVVFDSVTGYTFKFSTAIQYVAGVNAIYPTTADTYDLGTNTFRWDKIYVSGVHVNQYLYFSDTYVIGSLPSAAVENQIAVVSDALSPVNGSIVAAGGSVRVIVYSDGTNWLVLFGGSFPGGTGGVAASFKTGAYTAAAGDIVGVGSDTAAITITLPATPNTDDYVGVWDADDNAGTNNITVARNGETIDGSATDFIINVNGGRVDLIYNGTTWKVAYTTPGASGFVGKEDLWVPISNMRSDYTNGAGSGNIGTLGYERSADVLLFDASAEEYAGFSFPLPKRWDGGTISYTVYWAPKSTNTGDVLWQMLTGKIAEGDLLTGAHGGDAAAVTDTANGTTDDLHISAESAGMDLSAGAGKFLTATIRRQAGAGGDTFTADAALIGLMLHWTSEAPTDD